MGRTINVSDIIDTRPVGVLQLRAFLVCAAVLFVDGLYVLAINYVGPTISRELGLNRRRCFSSSRTFSRGDQWRRALPSP